MELLIIKQNHHYLRIKNGEFVFGSLEKASVFPLDKLDLIKQYLIQARELGHENTAIFRLVMHEEPFFEKE